MEWQPIETAPKLTSKQLGELRKMQLDLLYNGYDPNGFINYEENPTILLWARPFFEKDQDFGVYRSFCGYWSCMSGRWVAVLQEYPECSMYDYELFPTHWMPLPEPPK
jgi:hypothetical protein